MATEMLSEGVQRFEIIMRLRVPTAASLKRKRSYAFTLAEVMVAIGIIAFLFVSLFLGISYCFSVTQFERENLRATQIVLQRLEGIRLFNWQQLTNTTLNPTTFTARYFPGTQTQPASGLTYTGTVTVAAATLNPSATYSGNIKKVTVTVQWTSANHLTRTRSISTYSARDGIQNYIYSN